MADSRFSYKPVTSTDLELFKKHKNSIDSAIRKKFTSISTDFELKPVLARHMEACGTIHDYKVALPDNKFVKISFLTGAMQVYAPGQKPPAQPSEPEITVDDTLTSKADA